jgi:hypothetical protein
MWRLTMWRLTVWRLTVWRLTVHRRRARLSSDSHRATAMPRTIHSGKESWRLAADEDWFSCFTFHAL